MIRVDAEAEAGGPVMFNVKQGVDVGELGNKTKPAQGLPAEKGYRPGQGAGIGLHGHGIGGGRSFKNSYFRGLFFYVFFRLLQDFFNIDVYPDVRLFAQGGVQVTVLALAGAAGG